jgi:hypothetical protein
MSDVALLIDFDNVYPRGQSTAEELVVEFNRWVSLATRVAPDVETVNIRLYGGWHQGGELSKAASEVLARLPRSPFPLSIGMDGAKRLVRGSVELVSRLAALPTIQWGHTFRSHRGLPQLRLSESPRPKGCSEAENCPIDLVQRISRRRNRKCHVSGCSVSNEAAFLLREQKMVDVLLACDAIEYANRGHHLILISNDLDLLPSIATTTTLPAASVTLVRGPAAGDQALYTAPLEEAGVKFEELLAA